MHIHEQIDAVYTSSVLMRISTRGMMWAALRTQRRRRVHKVGPCAFRYAPRVRVAVVLVLSFLCSTELVRGPSNFLTFFPRWIGTKGSEPAPVRRQY